MGGGGVRQSPDEESSIVVPPASSRVRWIAHYDLVRIAVALSVLIFVALAVSRILYPYDTGEYEANAWAPSLLLAHFHNPYSPSLAVHPPFVASTYGPVYYAFVGLGLRIFGEQFWFARTIALTAGLLSAWLVFSIAYRFTRDRFTSMLGSALLLAQYPMLAWAGVQRPDVLALAFALSGLNLGLRPTSEPRHDWYPVWSALALLAAVLTRQTYVLPIAIVAVWYLLERDIVGLWRFGATLVLVGAVTVGGLWITSHGGLLGSLVTNQMRAPSRLSILAAHLRALAESPITWGTLVGVAFAGLAAVRAMGSADAERRRVVFVFLAYFCLASGLALVTGSRSGSNINYFIEPLVIASLLVGLAGSQALWLTSQTRRTAAVVVLCLGAAFIGVREGHGQLLLWQAKPYFAEIVSDIRHIPSGAGPMYSDYPELVDEGGHTSYVNDFVQYDGRSVALKKAFDRLLASGKLAAIIRASPIAPPGYVEVKVAAPRPVGVYVVYLYVRRNLASTLP